MGPGAELRGVSVLLDERAVLRGVDLELGPGLTIVRGPNGAGKTTLLRAIVGLVPIARGTRAVRGSMLYIGHRPQLLRALTARENLSFLSRFRGDAGAVEIALERWGLGAEDRPVERLSSGQRRRAALARLDSEDTDVVLLDEPFAELDEEAGALLRAAIARACDRGTAVLLATHGHGELDPSARRLAIGDGVLGAA